MHKREFSLSVWVGIIAVLGGITAGIGLFATSGGEAYDFINQYGDSIRMYGDGLYAHDSYFMAPIFRGTDFTILFLAVPLLIYAGIKDWLHPSVKTRMLLLSVLAVFVYYSASLAFGVSYNVLHLVYIALFSASFYSLIAAVRSMNEGSLAKLAHSYAPGKGVFLFLGITGVALIVAWLPDIIQSWVNGRSLALIEVYTTAITYVIDMGIIAPAAWICLAQLRRRKGMGLILLAMLLTVCCIVGVMLPIQSLFQALAGIELPLAAVLTKVMSFVLLAAFALLFNIRFYRSVGGEGAAD